MSAHDDAMRREFEAWVSAPPMERPITRYPDTSAWPGDYRDWCVSMCWHAWQAATAAKQDAS